MSQNQAVFPTTNVQNPYLWKMNVVAVQQQVHGWTLDMVGAYFLLLSFQWQNRTIPWSDASISKILGVSERVAALVKEHMDPFFVILEGSEQERRIEMGLHKQRERKMQIAQVRRKTGLKSAKAQMAKRVAKKRDMELADVVQITDELIARREEERKKKEEAKKKPPKDPDKKDKRLTAFHPDMNPIAAAQKFWTSSYVGRVRTGYGLNREERIVIAELAERYPYKELTTRMSEYIAKNMDKAKVLHFAQTYKSHAPAKELAKDGLTTKEAAAENKAQADFKEEFGLPKDWKRDEVTRRGAVITDYVRDVIPESELLADGTPPKKHYIPSRMLAALRRDKAENPHFYDEGKGPTP